MVRAMISRAVDQLLALGHALELKLLAQARAIFAPPNPYSDARVDVYADGARVFTTSAAMPLNPAERDFVVRWCIEHPGQVYKPKYARQLPPRRGPRPLPIDHLTVLKPRIEMRDDFAYVVFTK